MKEKGKAKAKVAAGVLAEGEVPAPPAKAKAMAKAGAPDGGEGPPPKAKAKGQAKAKAEAGAPADDVPAPKATGKAKALAKASAPAEEVPAPKAKGKAKARAKAVVPAEEVASPAEGEAESSSSLVTAVEDDAGQLAIGHDLTKVFCSNCKSWVNYQRCRVLSKQTGTLWKGNPLSRADASIGNSVLLQQCIATRCCLCIGHFLPVALRHLDVGFPIPVQQGRGGAATAV